MRINLSLAIVFILLGLVPANKSKSSVWPYQAQISISDNKKDGFRIEKRGDKLSVLASGLELTLSIKKPVTIPNTKNPVNWRFLEKTNTPKIIFGLNGMLATEKYDIGKAELIIETWIPEDKSLVAFRQSIINRNHKPMKLEYLYPLYISGKDSYSFGDENQWRILAQYRKKNDYPLSYSPFKKEATKEIDTAGLVGAYQPAKVGEDNADPFFIINNDNGKGKNLLIGHQSAYYHLADVTINFTEERLNEICANSDFEGVEVPLNGKRTSQWVVIDLGEDAIELMHEFALRLREFHDAPIPAQNAPTVFCSWYFYGLQYNENDFRDNIAAFRENRIPFDVFLIDESWALHQWGDWYARKDIFPSGMKWAADQIRSLGYTPGIWSPPFLVSPQSDLAKNHKEWILKNSKGEPCLFHMNSEDHFILDVTYPGAEQHLEEVYRRIVREWGYKYLKFDFMRAIFLDTDQQFYDKTATSLEAYRRGLIAIRRGAGKDAYISVCGGHYNASLGLCESQRSGSDVISKWREWELFKYRQNILRTWMSILWHVDPDAMMVRRHTDESPFENDHLKWGLFTDDEAFTNSVNQFIGGNLITFTEPFPIDKDRELLYRHVIPSVNQASKPLDPFNLHVPEITLTHIEPKCVNLFNWNILTVINWSNEKKNFRVSLDEKVLENLNGNLFIAFDFQSQEVLGTFNRGEEFLIEAVRPHHSHIIKLLPWDGRSATFIGTDLNYSCGGVEIEKISNQNGVFSGTIDTPWHVPVRLSFMIPHDTGFTVESINILPGQRHFLFKY